jgi:hypothetical protein
VDVLQFGLFFVALVVGYVLVHLRLVRFEEHLQNLAGIRGLDDRLRQLDDRLRQLAEAFERVRLERVEDKLDRLHETLEDLREVAANAPPAVVQIPAPLPPSEPAPAAAPGPSVASVVAMVENRLLQLGYHDVVVLSDLSHVDLVRELDLQVECWRGGMPVKGRVQLRNGSVRDVALQSVAQMFP